MALTLVVNNNAGTLFALSFHSGNARDAHTCVCVCFFALPVQDNGHGIVDDALPSNDVEERLVHANLLKDGKHCHGVHGTDERTKDEGCKER